LTNGTDKLLTDLKVQDCVRHKGARGSAAQTNTNKLIRKPYVACRSDDGRRWIVAAWEPCDRPWANWLCPCLHSDPKFPDCPPGASVRVHGGSWFYEGREIEAELRRIDGTASSGANGRLVSPLSEVRRSEDRRTRNPGIKNQRKLGRILIAG
jgi:hypothetical protein